MRNPAEPGAFRFGPLLAGLLIAQLGFTADRTAAAARITLAARVYGSSVPTQFILARMRTAMYMPLLSLGAAAWCFSGVPARVRAGRLCVEAGDGANLMPDRPSRLGC